jgi:hypothetical protein
LIGAIHQPFRSQQSPFFTCQRRSAGPDQRREPEQGQAMNIPSGLGDALLGSGSDAIVATTAKG